MTKCLFITTEGKRLLVDIELTREQQETIDQIKKEKRILGEWRIT